LASVMTMHPTLLILDEPTSQLDPIAASDFLAVLGKLNRDLGITILLTEHRLEEALPYATKVAVLDRGQILTTGHPKEVASRLRNAHHAMFRAMPTPTRIWAHVENGAPAPLTVNEGRQL